jgi:hypothetical protein
MLEKIHRIELDESIYGKAVITIYDKDGNILDRIFPKWNHRWVVLQEINKKWLEYLRRRR